MVKELDKIKTQRLASIEGSASDPQFLAVQRMSQINQFYPKGHPNYSPNIDEQIEMINEVSIESVQSFYDSFYGISDNASLVAIGSMDAEMVKTYFEDNFSNFRCDKPYKEIENPFNKIFQPTKYHYTRQEKCFYNRLLTLEATETDEDNAALQVAGTIFGGGFLNSRVATRLRQQDGCELWCRGTGEYR